MIITHTQDFLGTPLSIETGKLAKLAGGSVTLRYGDTMILVTATMGLDVREGIDYFPLLVDYQEKFYATGKMKGSRFIKREGRPSDSAILAARMIDRPLRPMFPKNMRNDFQVVVTILSADMVHNPEDISILGASLATLLTGVPFQSPIAGVRVGLVKNEDGTERLKVNPNYEELQEGRLDLMVAGTENAITMIESAAKEVDSDMMIAALELAHEHIRQLCAMQREFLAKVGHIPELTVALGSVDESLEQFVKEFVTADKVAPIFGLELDAFKNAVRALKDGLLAAAEGYMIRSENPWKKSHVMEMFNTYLHKEVRAKMLRDKTRLDGRGLTDIRPVSCEAGIIPRTHGSGLFNRGSTQVLSLATLGSPGDAQVVDEMDDVTERRYMHHYNFPGFSVGEVTPMRGVGRREIGHGDLAERALLPVLPAKEEFPYTIRVVSEVLGSNGSSSMGSVCGSTLCLMDAGVPIIRPVSGIAMGLVMDKETKEYVVLSDIQGQEDYLGDMDFKVAGTEKGITALQLDIKIEGLTMEILRKAIQQADTGRAFILERMLEALRAPKTELSKYAPRIITLNIPQASIGEVIGPGGKIIRGIIDVTGAKIDIEDSGLVIITSADAEGGEKARAMIQALTYVPQVGDEFDGKVTRFLTFGALVEYAPGKEALLHISEIAPFRINRVEDVLKMGQVLKVRVVAVEEGGKKISLSHKPFSTIPNPNPAPQPQA